MSENATSVVNKNSIIYGQGAPIKNEGPACVDGKGQDMPKSTSKPDEAPILAVREK